MSKTWCGKEQTLLRRKDHSKCLRKEAMGISFLVAVERQKRTARLGASHPTAPLRTRRQVRKVFSLRFSSRNWLTQWFGGVRIGDRWSPFINITLTAHWPRERDGRTIYWTPFFLFNLSSSSTSIPAKSRDNDPHTSSSFGNSHSSSSLWSLFLGASSCAPHDDAWWWFNSVEGIHGFPCSRRKRRSNGITETLRVCPTPLIPIS